MLALIRGRLGSSDFRRSTLGNMVRYKKQAKNRKNYPAFRSAERQIAPPQS